MSCANFQELLAGQGATTATDFTPANIDFPYDSDDELRLDIYNYEDQQWVNVPLATGATIDVGGAGDRFYAWETYLTDGQTGVRTILATAGTTPALPVGGTASHPLAPANNNYPVQGGTGVNVRLYRQTSIEAGEMPAYFYPGASIRAQDLNDNFEALRKVVEESSCGTDNVTNAIPQLDARYWNKTVDTIESGDAWQSDDDHIATTARGDARWLNATGGNVIGGAGIDVTEAGGNVTIAVDLAGTSGLETDPAGNNGELRIDVNDGCEIVPAGLNAETTAASIVQNGGSNISPIIRVATTLGDTTTNNDLQITGGTNVTVTRNSNNQLTIASTGGGGGGGNVAETVADVTALNTAADSANDGDLFLLLDSTNLNADSAQGDNDEDVNDLPMTVANGAPRGGYGADIQVTLEWDNANTRWQFIRWGVAEPDNRYINAVDGTTNTAADRQNIRFNGLDLVSGTNNNNDIIGYEMRFANTGSPEFQINAGGVGGGQNAEAATFQLSFGDQAGGGDTHGCFLTAGDRLNRNGRIDFTGTNTGNERVLAYTDRGGTAWNLDCDGDFDTIGSIEFANIRPAAGQDRFTLGLTSTPTETYTITFPATAANAGTGGNVWALTTSPADNDDVACDLAWTEIATAATVAGFVQDTGDTMTGNLQMDGASIIADNAENVPDADGNWDIQNSNVWQVANGRTIEFPDDSAAPIPGQTGIFVCAGTVAGWTDANGGTWEHPGGTAQAGNANGAIIPFYVQTATNIILGTQTVGS